MSSNVKNEFDRPGASGVQIPHAVVRLLPRMPDLVLVFLCLISYFQQTTNYHTSTEGSDAAESRTPDCHQCDGESPPRSSTVEFRSIEPSAAFLPGYLAHAKEHSRQMILSWIRIALIALYTGVLSMAAFFAAFVLRSPKLYHDIGRVYGKGVLFISGIRLTVEGLERVDFSRNYIYVSNHASMFDIPAILAAVPAGLSLMYKKELHRVPVFGWSLMLSKVYIPVDRGSTSGAMRSIDDAARKIHNGLNVLLFAEGTRTSDGDLQQFKRGAFSLAVKADVPVVPVTVNGSFHVMPRNSFRIRPGTVTVVLGTPIPIPSGEGKSAEIVLRDDVRLVIERHYISQKTVTLPSTSSTPAEERS